MLPMKTEDLRDWLPHRPPMVWIDEVTALGEGWAECRVYPRPDALFNACSTAAIEWMAQAYGFARAAEARIAKRPLVETKKAFLVGITDFTFHREVPRDLPFLVVRTEGFREIGTFALFRGELKTPSGDVLASGSLKVFRE